MKFHMQVLIALGLGLKRNWHIFAGLVLGVLVGIWLHKEPSPVIMTTLTFIGQVFIRLIQMVVIPLVISAIVIGITSIGDSKQLGKLGTKMIFYYTIITVAAVTIGAALALPALKSTLKTFDATQYGGAPLLGLNGLVVKTHGSAKAKEITNSIFQCVTFKEEDINGKIRKNIVSSAEQEGM